MSTKETKSIPTSLLVSAAYDNQKNIAVLKFYNPETQELNSSHKLVNAFQSPK